MQIQSIRINVTVHRNIQRSRGSVKPSYAPDDRQSVPSHNYRHWAIWLSCNTCAGELTDVFAYLRSGGLVEKWDHTQSPGFNGSGILLGTRPSKRATCDIITCETFES